MEISAYKLSLVERLLQIDDESVLQQVGTMLESLEFFPPKVDLPSMTPEEFRANIQEAEEQIDRREHVTLEELRKESEEWL